MQNPMSLSHRQFKCHGKSHQTFNVLTFSCLSTIFGLIALRDRVESIDGQEYCKAIIDVFSEYQRVSSIFFRLRGRFLRPKSHIFESIGAPDSLPPLIKEQFLKKKIPKEAIKKSAKRGCQKINPLKEVHF